MKALVAPTLLACLAWAINARAEEPKPIADLAEILRLRAESNKAYQEAQELFDRKEYEKAVAAMERCVTLQERLCAGKPPLPDYVTSLAGLGVLNHELGRLEPAEKALRKAMALRPKCILKPEGPECILWHSLALVLRDKAAADPTCFAEASDLLEKAVAEVRQLAAKKPDERVLAATIIENLALMRGDQGDRAEAEKLLREVVSLREGLGPKCPEDDRLAGYNNLGMALLSRDKFADAIPYLERNLEGRRRLFVAESNRYAGDELARSLSNLGMTEFQRFLIERTPQPGRPDPMGLAERMLREAVELTRHWLPATSPDLGFRLQTLALIRDIRLDHREAEQLFREALAIATGEFGPRTFPDGHPDLARAQSDLASCLDDQKRWSEAVPLHRAALTMTRHLIERFATVSTEDAAIGFANRQSVLLPAYLRSTRAAGTPAASVYPDVWSYKAALTRVYARRHAAKLASPAVRESLDALVAAHRARERLLLTQSRSPSPGAHEAEIRRLTELIRRLDRDVAVGLPTLALAAASARRQPGDLQRALPAGIAFVDFVRYHAPGTEPIAGIPGRFHRTARYAAFIVRTDSIDRVDFDEAAEIDRAIRDWRSAIDRPGAERSWQAESFGPHATNLRSLLWGPIADKLPDDVRVMYIAPDGELSQLPWAALPGKNADTILLDKYAFAVVPHGPFLLDRLEGPARRASVEGPLLAIGNVDYGLPGPTGRSTWHQLPNTAIELADVAGLAESHGISVRQLTRADATRVNALAELPRAHVAHLCTHGFFAGPAVRDQLGLDERLFEGRRISPFLPEERIGAGARNPMVLSGLALAGANRAENADGLLTAAAVLDLPLEHLDLVVLSACDTGLGETIDGEGVYGLQRAFHMAGAKNVVASLWKVDDDATAALVKLFYRNLWERHLSPVESLRLAQLSVYRHGYRSSGKDGVHRGPIEEKDAPSFPSETARTTTPVRLWAAFNVSGEGPVIGAEPIDFDEPAERKGSLPLILWIGIPFVAGTALALILARRRRAKKNSPAG